MKKQILKEDIAGILITLVFVLGFFVLVQLDSGIIGFSTGELSFGLPVESDIESLVNNLDVNEVIRGGGHKC